MTTLRDVLELVGTLDEDEMGAVWQALQARHEELHEQRARAVHPGCQVSIFGVEPAFLEGLEGEVVDEDLGEGTVDVLLTSESTGRLRFCGQRQYTLGAVSRFLLEGVPTSCCYVVQGVVAAQGAGGESVASEWVHSLG